MAGRALLRTLQEYFPPGLRKKILSTLWTLHDFPPPLDALKNVANCRQWVHLFAPGCSRQQFLAHLLVCVNSSVRCCRPDGAPMRNSVFELERRDSVTQIGSPHLFLGFPLNPWYGVTITFRQGWRGIRERDDTNARWRIGKGILAWGLFFLFRSAKVLAGRFS